MAIRDYGKTAFITIKRHGKKVVIPIATAYAKTRAFPGVAASAARHWKESQLEHLVTAPAESLADRLASMAAIGVEAMLKSQLDDIVSRTEHTIAKNTSVMEDRLRKALAKRLATGQVMLHSYRPPGTELPETVRKASLGDIAPKLRETDRATGRLKLRTSWARDPFLRDMSKIMEDFRKRQLDINDPLAKELLDRSVAGALAVALTKAQRESAANAERARRMESEMQRGEAIRERTRRPFND